MYEALVGIFFVANMKQGVGIKSKFLCELKQEHDDKILRKTAC